MENLFNKRFIALQWSEREVSWQNILGKLDQSIDKIATLCVNSSSIYFIFGPRPPSLFLARSITGHLLDYCRDKFYLIDLDRCSTDFREGPGEDIWDNKQYFSHLADRQEKGFVEITQQTKEGISYYVFRESMDSSLPLRFV